MDSTLALDHRLWCQAAALLLPPASAIGLRSAAHLYGVRGLDTGGPVVVLAPCSVALRTQLSATALLAYLESHSGWPGIAAARQVADDVSLRHGTTAGTGPPRSRALRFNADDVLRFRDRMVIEIRTALRRS